MNEACHMKISFLSKTEINISHFTRAMASHHVTVCRNRAQLLEAIRETEVLVVQNQGFARGTVDAECLGAARKLRLIQHHGVTCDITDVGAAAKLGIPVATIPGQNSRSVAEHAFFLLLALARKSRRAQRLVQAGEMGELECVELEGKTLCVVGTGAIGKMVAKMAGGFGMTAVGVRKTAATEDALEAGFDAVHAVRDLHQTLAGADFVVLALPLNDGTLNLIDAGAFRAMKRGAMLINVSRGPHVNRDALEQALAEDAIGGFATDAYWDEPVDSRDPLLQDERVLITPHMGGKSIEAIRRSVAAVRRNIERLAAGEPLLNVVAA